MLVRSITVFLFLLPAVVPSVLFAPKGRLDSGPNADPISTTPPNFPGGEVVVDAFPGPFFQDFSPPLPTDSWWVGLGVGNQDAVLAGPFPFQSLTRNNGFEFGVSRDRRFDGTSIIQGTQLDWSIAFDGLPEVLNNRKTTGWDTQTVCLQYFDGGRTMDTCLVPGSPYMTFTFANAVVRLKSLKGDISSFQWVEQGKKLKITSTEGGTYVLYVLSGNLDFVQNELTLTSTTEFSGRIRMAKIYDGDSQEAVLDAHRDSVPNGVNFEYQIAGDESTMTWTWQVDGDANNLLMLCWPHHRKVLVAPNYVDIQYMTIKGYMKGVLGNRWVLKHSLPTVTWFPPNPPHPSCLAELEKTLESDVEDLQVREPGDFYFWGGAFARDATLATIAEQLGRQDLVDRTIDIVKQSIGFFFDPTHFPRAAYEKLWGGMVNDRDLNYTRAYFNDHHFLYGYWLHGAAIIGRADPNWLNEHLDFFNHMSRDIGNPSPKDPHYTVVRHMDWFAGHSWASGIANGAGPRDQESSGEAINGYYGLLLWADVTNNAVLRDWARLLLAIELAGAQHYWHLYPKVNDPDTPYPEQDFRELVTVGNVMDTQAGAWLFWGGQRIQVAAIQILPLTPLMALNYDKPWIEEVYPYCRGELEDITIGGAFKSVIYAAYAGVDSDVAYAGSRDLIDWGSGNSATNQLYFVATHSSKTDNVCPSIDETPEGLYIIQDVSTGKYVTIIVDGILSASAGADVLASKFRLKFKAGGSSIFSVTANLFVTGLTEAGGPLKAIANAALSNEIFRWSKDGDYYKLQAMVNRKAVHTDADGHLVNTEGQSSSYKLIPVDETEPESPPSNGRLKNLQSNNYVSVTSEDPVLRANIADAGSAPTWSFERIPESPDNAKLYAIRSDVTKKVVTGNPDSTSPLVADRDEPSGWEDFEIVKYQSGWIIIHGVTGRPVSLQSDSTLLDNGSDISDAALWSIE